MKRAWIAIASFLPACAMQSTHVLDLMDADTDAAIAAAAGDAARYLADPRRSLEVRKASAKTLGRLRHGSPEAIAALGGVLANESEPAELRAYAAWALGEQRNAGALSVLTGALRRPMDALTGRYTLEALAKHYALMSASEDRLVEVVEAMVHFAGNQKGRPPAIYDVLGARTRTLPVNVRVLERAVEEASLARDQRHLAAMYNATYETLERIDRARAEIAAGSAAYKAQVEAAVRMAHRAFAVEDQRTQALALWYLGRLADLGEVATPAADALAGANGERAKRPSLARSPAVRLLAAWAFARLQLHAPGPRQALAADLLPREAERAVLELLGDLSRRAEEGDQLQKILGIEERAP